jgi:hypothetical protein
MVQHFRGKYGAVSALSCEQPGRTEHRAEVDAKTGEADTGAKRK